MSGLEEVREFVIPLALIDRTLDPIMDAGRAGYEAFVLWGGRKGDDGRFEFAASYFPRQQASRGPDGLLVTVDGEALFRANQAFYNEQLTLAGQVHSHPGTAYHSPTDDVYPLMTLLGGLSAVVPDFGRGGAADLPRWKWYRLWGPAEWSELDSETEISFTG